MRRLMLMAALAAATTLAGCTLKTPEGAACDHVGDVDQCPEGQRCGADGKCSVAAVACEEICTASTCGGTANKILNRCEQAGVCASLGSDVVCSEHQDCDADAGACVCRASACGEATASLCNAGGELVACTRDPGTNCPYEEPPVGCGALKECKDKDATSAECRCKAAPECTEVGVFCIENNTRLVTCDLDETCLHARVDERCGLGKTCESGACACPPTDQPPVVGGGCANVDDLACDATTLLSCLPVAVGSTCNAWQVKRPCGSDLLACSSTAPGVAACVCPPFDVSPRTLIVDRNAPGEVGIERNGANNPICRYTSLKVALDAALEGDTVKASGAAPTMEFIEGPLIVKRGSKLTTSDLVPTPANYVILPADGVGASALVMLQPGATISGFELRNRSATGSAIASSCSDQNDTAADTVTVASVGVSGQGTITPTARFQHGVGHGGKCSLILRDSVIEGARDSGVSIFPAIPISLSMTGNTVRLNAGTELFTINGVNRSAGGVLLRGEAPAAVVFNANTIVGNQGDQVLVYMTGDVDLSAPDCQSANVFACYTAPGVGVSSFAQNLFVRSASWPKVGASLQPGIDFEFEPSKNLSGAGVTCPVYPSASCPQ